MTETCSICMPRLLNAKAPVSSRPMSVGCQLEAPGDLKTGVRLKNSTESDANEPVIRMSHREAKGPVAAITRSPNSQKSIPKKVAASKAQAMPDFAVLEGSPESTSPRATRITPSSTVATPKIRKAERRSAEKIERKRVRTG